MTTNHNLYKRYTSSIALTTGDDEKAILKWSQGYFHTFYGKLLPTDKNLRILEVGCGYGRYIKSLNEMGYKNCYGIDISEEQTHYASTILGLSNVEQADALEWLTGKDGMFDCILALDVLEHLETEKLLELGEKMCLALKPGGKVIIQVPNGMAPLNPVRYGDLTHVRAFTVKSMEQFFLMVGFSPTKFYEIPPYIHGVVSAIRRVLWTLILKPVIISFMLIANGGTMGNIYTSNFIAVAERNANLVISSDDTSD